MSHIMSHLGILSFQRYRRAGHSVAPVDGRSTISPASGEESHIKRIPHQWDPYAVKQPQ